MNDKLLSLLGMCRRAGKLAPGFEKAAEAIEKHKAEIKALKEKKKIVMEKIKKADLIRINEAVKKSNKSVDEIIDLISK